MKYLNHFLLIILIFLSNRVIAEVQTIKVGAYIFPPYFEKETLQKAGAIVDLINLLNKSQTDFNFEVYETSPKRRYQDFLSGKYDVILFESPLWGWDKYKDKISFYGDTVVDEEVFITSQKKFKEFGDSYFEDLKGKSIGVFLGYHYKFANYNSDETYLRKNFNAYVSSSHVRNIISVSKERVDLAIVTRSFINMYLLESPQLREVIYVSKTYDQQYLMKIGIRNNYSVNELKIKKVIDKVVQTEEYKNILKKYFLK